MEEGKERCVAALLAADLWQWQIKPVGVATLLLKRQQQQPSSICVRHARETQKSVARFRQTFVIKQTPTSTVWMPLGNRNWTERKLARTETKGT